jgi:outer membrane receptor protein involved in Fe transport
MKISKIGVAVLLVSLVSLSSLYGFQGAAKGSIKGKVTESKTKEALPGVNITVKGTYYGAVSDIDGNFTIKDINPGTYTVEISLIGYKKYQFGSVTVTAGEVTPIDAKLEETVLSLGQEIVIVGDKPLFNIEETQSAHTMNTHDVKSAAVRDVQNIVALQTGVVQSDGEIHIRGGRTYENAYLVDGISVQDPLGGTGFGLQVSSSAIQDIDVITGGYNAEYGQATSGIVNITTKEGSKEYKGSLSLTRDHFGFNDNSRTNERTDIYEGSISGPEPITHFLLPSLGLQIPGDVSFFGSVYANLSDNYTIWTEQLDNTGKPTGYGRRPMPHLYSSLFPNSEWLSPRADNSWSWFSKLTYKPTSTMKVSYSNSGSITINQDTKTVQATLEHVEPNPGFQYEFMQIPDSANTFTQFNMQQTLAYVQTLSTKSFYELRFSRYAAHVRADANGKNYTDYIEPKDIITFPIQYYNLGSDTIGVIPGDGFYDVGNASRWRDQSTIEYTFKGDFTNNFSENHKFKTGFEARFQDLQMIDVLQPWYKPIGLNNDFYKVHPALGALYAQENITLRGMILNVGLRLDYWFPGGYVDDAVEMPASQTNIPENVRQAYWSDTYNIFGRRMKARLSPRLGISHPVSDMQSLFFSYGHFSKFPRPEFVYSKLVKSTARTSYPTIGNPDLNPETTVSYELGLRNQISGNDVLTVTAYYKDIFDYITARTLSVQGSRFSSYTTYVNLDYSRIRGIEAEYKTRLSDWFRAEFSGSYSVATGKSSTADDQIYNLSLGLTETITEQPAVFDRPLQLTTSFNFTYPKDGMSAGFADMLFKNSSAYVRVFYESGKRYTKQIHYADDPTQIYINENGEAIPRPMYTPDYAHPYSEIGDPWFYINCNINKYFDVPFGRLTLSLEIRNLLDRKNSQIINPVTGRAYEYGDPTAYPSSSVNDPLYPDLTYPVTAYSYNPSRYLTPRTIRLGLEWSF